MNNYDYPIGSDTSDAPWNQSTPEPQKVDVMVSYSMSKSTVIENDNYIEEPYEDWDTDDDKATCNKGTIPDWSNTNWEQAFEEDSNALGIPDLLSILEEHATIQYHLYKDALEDNPNDKQIKRLINKWGNIKKACQDWHVDEFIVEHE